MDSNTKNTKDSNTRLQACPDAAALKLLLLSWVLQPEICRLKCRPAFTSAFPSTDPATEAAAWGRVIVMGSCCSHLLSEHQQKPSQQKS